MARERVWLSGWVSYDAASAIFERMGGRVVARSSIWKQVQAHGPRLPAYRLAQQQRVSPERVILPGAHADHRQPKGIGLEGGMVNIRQEGWKEMKVGVVCDVEQRLEHDPETRELVEQAHGVNVADTAVLGSAQNFAPALWALAGEQGVPQAAQSSVTADGAEWIGNLVADYFPDSVQIVAGFHACQHLAEAATALFPDQPETAQHWLKQRKDDLLQGAIPALMDPLDAAGLAPLAHYFRPHQRRMHYQEFRELGFPIGSGTTESEVKQFKARMTGPGMRWSRQGAEEMLVIRAAVLAARFDRLWRAAA